MGDERQVFLKTYSNLPLKTREEIVVVLDEKPITWDSAYLEIKNNTDTGKRILIKLKDMRLL